MARYKCVLTMKSNFIKRLDRIERERGDPERVPAYIERIREIVGRLPRPWMPLSEEARERCRLYTEAVRARCGGNRNEIAR